jgi:hypothetical protein
MGHLLCVLAEAFYEYDIVLGQLDAQSVEHRGYGEKRPALKYGPEKQRTGKERV